MLQSMDGASPLKDEAKKAMNKHTKALEHARK